MFILVYLQPCSAALFIPCCVHIVVPDLFHLFFSARFSDRHAHTLYHKKFTTRKNLKSAVVLIAVEWVIIAVEWILKVALHEEEPRDLACPQFFQTEPTPLRNEGKPILGNVVRDRWITPHDAPIFAEKINLTHPNDEVHRRGEEGPPFMQHPSIALQTQDISRLLRQFIDTAV